MKLFLILYLLIGSLVLNVNHPVTLLIFILMQTLTVCASIWMMIKSSWLAFILFIIFLGGMMILFVYITSLASNEKFDYPIMYSTFFVIPLLIFMIVYMFNPLTPSNFPLNMNFYKMISFMLEKMSAMIVVSIMLYLLITLIVAVKISNKFEGPLRNLN